MNLIHFLLAGLLFVLYLWLLYNVPILAVGVKHLHTRRKEKSIRSNRDKLPKISLVTPVKNEGKVVERLLDTLLSLDYPPSKKEIIIVEDGSTDKTVEICQKYVEQHPDCVKLLRRSASNGKGSALNFGFRNAGGKIIGIFDADNVPEPDVLLKVAKFFEEDSSVAAIQGRTCSINADQNILTKFISYEETFRFETYMRGKNVLNLFVPLTGTCQFIRRDILKEIGGWNEKILSEDMEMAARLTEKGYNIRYVPEVRSWQETPAKLTHLFKQRTRWFRGCMEVSLEYGRLVSKFNKKRIDAEITLVGPYMLILGLIGYLLALYGLFVPVELDSFVIAMAQIMSFLTTMSLFIVGVALAYVIKPRRFSNLLWLPFIYAYWSLQAFIALYALIQIALKRPAKWVKTTKTGIVTDNFVKKGI